MNDDLQEIADKIVYSEEDTFAPVSREFQKAPPHSSELYYDADLSKGKGYDNKKIKDLKPGDFKAEILPIQPLPEVTCRGSFLYRDGCIYLPEMNERESISINGVKRTVKDWMIIGKHAEVW